MQFKLFPIQMLLSTLVNDLQHEAAGMRRRLRMPDVD